MSALLRSLLALSFASLVLVGCGDKEATPTEEAPAAAAPAASATEVAPAAETAPAATEPGGYVPTPEERVPGVTIDTSAQPVTEATPAEAAPATTEAK